MKSSVNEHTAKQNRNCKVKIRLETLLPVLYQSHLVNIVSVSLGTNVPVTLRKSCVSLTWKQSHQSRLGKILPVSFGNSCTSRTGKNRGTINENHNDNNIDDNNINININVINNINIILY